MAHSAFCAILLFDLANHQRVSPCLYNIQVEIAKALLPDAFRSYLLLVAFLLLACCSNEKLIGEERQEVPKTVLSIRWICTIYMVRIRMPLEFFILMDFGPYLL